MTLPPFMLDNCPVREHTADGRSVGRCWFYCPDSAIVLDGETFTGFDLDYCKGCAICAEVCPVGAIEMVAE